MRVLLDTQAFLWFVSDDQRLMPVAKQVIEDASNQRVLSAASHWEMAIKTSIGRLSFTLPFGDFMTQHLALNQISILHIELAHTMIVATLPFHHRDPFDRLIVAQSMAENIPIISSDRALDAYGVQRIWE